MALPKFKALPVVDRIPMADRGTELYTTRLAGVTTGGSNISFPVDIKEAIIHIEYGTETALITGTVAGSTAAHLTSLGTNIVLPLVREADAVIANIAAPTGTINVSAFAWR
jgi:hypothetical protein